MGTETPASAFWADRTVCITGGSGSFGNAFTRFLLSQNIRAVRIFSRGEHRQAEMEARFHDGRLRFLIGDVRDRDRMRRAFGGCSVVVHAAALKRVERGEYDPLEFLKTNTIGAANVVEASLDAGVSRVVALSTDKAAAPLTHYGVTKLAAERIFCAANAYGGNRTQFLCVRYGNVVGSQGSVVPLWLKQRETGSITITDERMTRFWMTLGEAVSLVDRAAAHGYPGTVLIPRLPAVRILDLAAAVAPGVPHAVIGIRASEKLHEALVSTEEAPVASPFGDDLCLGAPNPLGIPGPYESSNAPLLSIEQIVARLPAALRDAA